MATTTSGASPNFYNKAKSWMGGSFPNFKQSMSGAVGGNKFSMKPEGFDYNFKGTGALGMKGAGLKAFGKSLGTGFNVLNAAGQGIEAAKGLGDLSGSIDETDDLKSNILRSSMSNPLASNYLSGEQQSLLNQLKRGGFDDRAGLDDALTGVGGNLDKVLMGVLTGAMGGVPGMVIGGVGGLINGGISGANEAQAEKTSSLETLYQALADAEAQYRSMKRPNFTGLGIQQQYQNQFA